jgi:hypothetical protein
MYICINEHICTCAYMCICIDMYICICTRTRNDICMYLCIYIHTYRQRDTRKYTHGNTYTHTYIIYTHKYIYIYIYVCIYIHIYIYIHTYIHTYIFMQLKSRLYTAKHLSSRVPHHHSCPSRHRQCLDQAKLFRSTISRRISAITKSFSRMDCSVCAAPRWDGISEFVPELILYERTLMHTLCMHACIPT